MQGYTYFFLFLLRNSLGEAVVTCIHNLCIEQQYQRHQNEHQNFPMKFSIFAFEKMLCMQVFVMIDIFPDEKFRPNCGEIVFGVLKLKKCRTGYTLKYFCLYTLHCLLSSRRRNNTCHMEAWRHTNIVGII